MDLALLLLQLVVILVATRLAGRAVALIGQPPVIGEMAAGIALGPSLLGALSPTILATVFPADRMVPLAALAQLGVLLFLFVVGLRVDLEVLRSRAHAAVAVSHTSIIVPFILGMGLAKWLHPMVSPQGVPLLPFALFLGAAMSVTAFPVLARILTDRNLERTQVGSVAISSAAVDDATAWCVLAGVVAVARVVNGSARGIDAALEVAATLAACIVFVLFLIYAVRPLLQRLQRNRETRGAPPIDTNLVAFAVLIALAAGWVTERIGVHALFGAFVAGVAFPRRPIVVGDGTRMLSSDAIAGRIEDVVSAVMLPLFFVYTGLRTSIALVSSPELWMWTVLIIVVAVVGKLGGSSIAARFTGMSWRDAGAVGVLMNTRGLMELVVLNVGLDIGLISPTLFSMMVIMALTTTMMTAPLLQLLGVGKRQEAVDGIAVQRA